MELFLPKTDILKIYFEFEISNGQYMSEVVSSQTPDIEENRMESNYWILQKDLKNLYKNRDDVDYYKCRE